jgi:hypothetical protein
VQVASIRSNSFKLKQVVQRFVGPDCERAREVKRAGTCEVKQSFERSSDEAEEGSNDERVVSYNLAIYKATRLDARQQWERFPGKSVEAFNHLSCARATHHSTAGRLS